MMIALDFKKAYDSINRGKLIETLVKYKIHPALIDIIAKVYSGDRTTIRMGGKEVEIRITSGIKQGCTASTVFFKLITFLIIEHLEREGMMINIEGMRMNSLWFADDSIVLANSVEGAIKNIRQVRNISRTFGLELNEEKSALIINKGSI